MMATAAPPSMLTTFPLLLTQRQRTRPTFDRVPESIEVWPGQTAVLSCVVRNQGDRVVSWIRSSDLQILASGRIVFTSDSRFTVDTVEAEEVEDNQRGELDQRQLWTLTLRQARTSDEGLYECQLNTEPKSRANVTLVVREPALADTPQFSPSSSAGVVQIERSSSEPLLLNEGDTIRLVCRAHVPPIADEPGPSSAMGPLVRWSLDGDPITSDTWRANGVNINTESSLIDRTEVVTSVLTLTRAAVSDSGSYGCEVRSLKGAGDRRTVYVMGTDESHPASSNRASQSTLFTLFLISGMRHCITYLRIKI